MVCIFIRGFTFILYRISRARWRTTFELLCDYRAEKSENDLLFLFSLLNIKHSYTTYDKRLFVSKYFLSNFVMLDDFFFANICFLLITDKRKIFLIFKYIWQLSQQSRRKIYLTFEIEFRFFLIIQSFINN